MLLLSPHSVGAKGLYTYTEKLFSLKEAGLCFPVNCNSYVTRNLKFLFFWMLLIRIISNEGWASHLLILVCEKKKTCNSHISERHCFLQQKGYIITSITSEYVRVGLV